MNNNKRGQQQQWLLASPAKRTPGRMNVAVGSEALRNNLTGSATIVGYRAANNITSTGNTAWAIGRSTTLRRADFNVALGVEAGYDETGSNKLFIDNQQRGSEANGLAPASLIYGTFFHAPLSQTLTFNAKVGINTTAQVQARTSPTVISGSRLYPRAGR